MTKVIMAAKENVFVIGNPFREVAGRRRLLLEKEGKQDVKERTTLSSHPGDRCH